MGVYFSYGGEEAEKLYNVLVDQLVCEAVNENVAKQSTEATSSSLPALPLEGDGNNKSIPNKMTFLPKTNNDCCCFLTLVAVLSVCSYRRGGSWRNGNPPLLLLPPPRLYGKFPFHSLIAFHCRYCGLCLNCSVMRLIA